MQRGICWALAGALAEEASRIHSLAGLDSLAVLDFGGSPSLLFLFENVTLTFLRTHLQGTPRHGFGWDRACSLGLDRVSAALICQVLGPLHCLAADLLLLDTWKHATAQSAPQLVLCYLAAGFATPSSVVSSRSTSIPDSPLWPTIDGTSGHEVRQPARLLSWRAPAWLCPVLSRAAGPVS
jgi:hypothetical protein